ncbi:MAG TPA: SDR family oxidoreductase [Thermoanaerobaculia bacterium]|nr:SDR family oxidoreductase [Thermoanaerobaculia bacterium]
MDLSGKNALVTGGAHRLGRAVALALGAAGCHVAVHYRTSAEPAEAVGEELRGLGVEAVSLAADLADADACGGLIARAVAALGPLHLLVNNAAIFPPGDLATTTAESWDQQLAVNLRAPFLLSRAFAAQLPADAEGSIVNLADARAHRPGRDHLAYRVSKAGLAHLTQLLALELAPRVRVNAIAPGAILPLAGETEEELLTRLGEQIPLRRVGGAEAVVEAMLYLLRASFATGVVLRLDGGEYL